MMTKVDNKSVIYNADWNASKNQNCGILLSSGDIKDEQITRRTIVQDSASAIELEKSTGQTIMGKEGMKMRKKTKILMALDNSGYKEKIMQYSINLARALNADVVAVHVVTKASLGTTGDVIGYYRGGNIESYLKQVKRAAEKLLNEAKEIGKGEDVNVTTAALTGFSSAADTIIHYAKEQQVDLIVIGTKGMTGIEKFLIGSVANNVIIHAHCPVLAIR